MTKRNFPPLSTGEKIAYGLGDMASNLFNTVVNLYLLFFYTEVWGIDPSHAGFMFLITKLIDAATDPTIGLIADRTNTRWGKYRPYILWMMIPFAFLGYLLYLGPELGEVGNLVYAYVTYSLFMLAYTAVNVPYSALLAVIHPQSEEREKATQYRFVFASLGSLVIAATMKPLVSWLGQGVETDGFRSAIIIFAICSVLLLSLTFLFTKERTAPKIQQDSKIWEDLKVLVQNISWVVLAVSGILIVIGLVSRLASVNYYTKYILELDSQIVFGWLDATSFISSCGFVAQMCGALLTPIFLKKMDKKKLMIAICFVAAAGPLLNQVTPNLGFAGVSAFHALFMFGFGVMITLLFAMYTDCSEYGEWVSGKNSAGLTVSSSMFSLKTGGAIGSALVGFALSSYGYISKAETQIPKALEGISMVFNVLPGLFFLTAGVLVFFYRIDGAMLKKIEADLNERRELDQGA